MIQNTIELSETQKALQIKRNIDAIPRRSEGSRTPLSFGQQQVWLLGQMVPDSLRYNESIFIYLPGPLNITALEQSLNEILRRHEAWRTSFPLVDGQPVQRIYPSQALILPVVDLRHFSEAERQVEALRLETEQACVPFDLANGPLLRAALMQLGNQEHQLYLTLHHIICDSTALFQVFFQELHTLYQAFSTGQHSPLPELPIQYADFAIWQHKQLKERIFADQLAYWKQRLVAAPTALALPTNPRPVVKTHQRSRYSFALSGQLTAALKSLSSRESVSLFITLAAALNTLLHRYTGQDDVLIGTVVAGRNYPETQQVLGLFLNTLVLRTDLSGNPTFRELLARVREVILQAEAHQEVPFEYLVKELRSEREFGQNPLFQVMLTLQPSLPVLPSAWTLPQAEVNSATDECDISLIFTDQPEGLIGRFEYNTDLFDEPTIARMVGHLQTLLEGTVNDSEQLLSELPLLTEAERHQLLIEWNATQSTYPQEQFIPQLFEAQVERTPDVVALVFEGLELTYRELNERANQLAHHLQFLGVGPEVLVGMYLQRSVEMIVGLLAVLKAGGAYVPLDPMYPQERLAFMIQDSQVAVLLTQVRLVEQLPQHAAQVVCLDTDWQIIAQQGIANPVCKVGPENLSYVIYTSGSTGKPKGVAIVHRSTGAFVHWARSVFSSEDLAGVLASTSICFDLSVFELFVPLSCGGTVLLVESALHLPQLTTGRRVTLLNTVPSAAAELVRSNSIPTSVRTVNLAGEPLHRALVRQLYQQDTIQRVFNLYGPTEDTTYSTYALVEKGEREPTIGRPISNTQVYILDSHLQPVPLGVVGELYIGGNGLARGYLNRPELTAERFIPHPFSQKPGTRLYKTGDLARYRPDGAIEFLGRIDRQVKIRGFRVEPGEIEAALGDHPAVQEAVVVAHQDSSSRKRLVAYVVLHTGQVTTVSELQDHILKELPAYMMPSAFVWLEALPLTPNGKVDLRALPEPDQGRYTLEEPFVAPTSLLHHQLREIWEELLERRPIGIRDNFFYVGGDSLLAGRLVGRMEQVFGKKLPLSLLFAGPTIEQLTLALQTEEETRSRAPLVTVQAGGSCRPFFYLHGAWNSDAFYCFHLAHRLGPDQPFYALPPYNFAHLQTASTVEEMAAAHIQSLRTVQPEGPYLLGGFCNGGLVAYEMARQLRAQGQEVDLLVLIVPAYAPVLHAMVRRAIHFIGKLFRLGQERQLACFLRLRHMYKYALHQRKLEDLKAFRRIDPSILTLFPTADALLQDDHALLDWIVTDYSYDPYPGKTTLLWAREEPFPGVWRLKAAREKNIALRVIPGTHIGCRTDHIQSLAEELSRCISEAQTTELKESNKRENISVSVD
jgi:amino acid adenylation domain-containing protein